MTLHNVAITDNGMPASLVIQHGRITSIGPGQRDNAEQLFFDEAIVFPGIINSHDHLDFNLFPQLGNRHYRNYIEWATHIHTHHKTAISQVLTIPESLRIQWGIYKNLLCGVTTVVNHGKHIPYNNSPIDIFQQCHVLHSVQFEQGWKRKVNMTLKRRLPVAIHTGEGIDELAHKEINELVHWNFAKRKLVGIHGVAMNEEQAANFHSLVWCPASNYYMFNTTAPVSRLKNHTHILFGSDSTLTSHWDIWQHVRLARETGLLTDTELYHSMNASPAATWGLPNRGSISSGATADIVIARKKTTDAMQAFFATTPEDILLVVKNGMIILFDESLLPQLRTIHPDDYSRIRLAATSKFVYGNLPSLVREIQKYHTAVQLPVEI